MLSPPRDRIRSARKGADLFISKDIHRASRLLNLAINLLLKTNLRTEHRDQKQVILGQFNALASDAAAIAIRANISNPQLSEVVRLLELGRGLMATAYLDTRSDITELKSRHPELAERFEYLRSEVDSLSSDIMPQMMRAVARRYEASKEFDDTINFIRYQKGFERFLLGPSSAELKSLASSHPIVYVNVSRFGADAILITNNDLHHLPLEKLLYADVERNTAELLKVLENHNVVTARRDKVFMKKILEWLWDVCVEPILEKLGFTQGPENVWPRLMWVPVGPLVLFPLHAASHGDLATIDRVISLYTPTLRALSHAKCQVENTPRKQSVLSVSMPTTPNQSPLPYAIQEVNTISSILPSSVPQAVLENPTKLKVMHLLAEYAVVHFACHGQVYPNPSKSRLLFSDWEIDPFSVADMAGIELEHPRLEVLSACHAANMRNLTLIDEAIHMAGACQLAGFPTVIGTLWQVQDQFSPVISEYLYRGMLTGDGILDVSKAAAALHFAVRKVREESKERKTIGGKWSDDPMGWAPYILVGI